MSLYGALAENERQGKEVICHEEALASNGELAIGTSLAQIDSVALSIRSDASPTTDMLTWDFSDGTVTVYGWASGTASTGEETISATIIGRRRH